MNQQHLYYILSGTQAAPGERRDEPVARPDPLDLAGRASHRIIVLNAFGWVVGPGLEPTRPLSGD